MADKQLDKLYEGIDISDADIALLREKLSLELSQSAVKEKTGADEKSAFWAKLAHYISNQFPLKSAYVVASIVAATTALIIFLNTNGSTLQNSNSLQEIERFVAENGDYQQLLTLAEELKISEREVSRLNALAVLSMMGTEANHKMASAQGLVEDPRPEFRAHYLEYLLDYADEDNYNVSYIEALMDKEEDEECLYLLGRLLKLALSRQADDSTYI